jgi:transcriptional regulator with XRE-family HTH domain
MSNNVIEPTVSLPERLRQLRWKRDCSWRKLANKAGIDIQRISKYERALSSPPLETLTRIATALDVSLNYLLTGKSGKTEKLKNAKLIECIEEVENLPLEYQEPLISVLDSLFEASCVGSSLAIVRP